MVFKLNILIPFRDFILFSMISPSQEQLSPSIAKVAVVSPSPVFISSMAGSGLFSVAFPSQEQHDPSSFITASFSLIPGTFSTAVEVEARVSGVPSPEGQQDDFDYRGNCPGLCFVRSYRYSLAVSPRERTNPRLCGGRFGRFIYL
jgi:hypothetical protein